MSGDSLIGESVEVLEGRLKTCRLFEINAETWPPRKVCYRIEKAHKTCLAAGKVIFYFIYFIFVFYYLFVLWRFFESKLLIYLNREGAQNVLGRWQGGFSFFITFSFSDVSLNQSLFFNCIITNFHIFRPLKCLKHWTFWLQDGKSIRQRCQFIDTKFDQGKYNYNTLQGFGSMTLIDAHR